MFAQESVMDIKKLKAEFEKLKYIEEKLEYLNFDEHLDCYVEKSNGMPVGLAAWVNGALYGFNQAATAQAVPEWIETAIQPPEEGQKVIISGIYGVGIAEFSYLHKDEFVMYDMGASNPILSKDQVKFWVPLLDAPQEPTND